MVFSGDLPAFCRDATWRSVVIVRDTSIPGPCAAQPPPTVKFLVVDDNPDNRFLVSKTLLRKFPKAAVVECQTLETALGFVRQVEIDLVVAHRTPEAGDCALIRELRNVSPTMPIIAISSIDRRTEVMAAGANRVHLTDEWLLIGSAAVELLQSDQADLATLPR